MEHKEVINPQDLQIQGLLDGYLRRQIFNDSPAAHHLDEDTLATLTEGGLTEQEAQPVIKHLVSCAFCRKITKELIKLELAFAENEVPLTSAINPPSKISEVLGTIVSRIFGTDDDAVFAHQEKDKNADQPDEVKSKQD